MHKCEHYSIFYLYFQQNFSFFYVCSVGARLAIRNVLCKVLKQGHKVKQVDAIRILESFCLFVCFFVVRAPVDMDLQTFFMHKKTCNRKKHDMSALSKLSNSSVGASRHGKYKQDKSV